MEGGKVNARLAAIAFAAACSVLVAAGAAAATGPQLSVQPKIGSNRAHFVISFTAQETGRVGASDRRYRVLAIGSSRRGCGSSASVAVPPTRQGQRVRATLAPPGRSHVWCRGGYAGRLEEIFQPVCGFREVCPYARDVEPVFVAIRTVARFSFRVR